MSVQMKKFELARVNGGSNYDSLYIPVTWRLTSRNIKYAVVTLQIGRPSASSSY